MFVVCIAAIAIVVIVATTPIIATCAAFTGCVSEYLLVLLSESRSNIGITAAITMIAMIATQTITMMIIIIIIVVTLLTLLGVHPSRGAASRKEPAGASVEHAPVNNNTTN